MLLPDLNDTTLPAFVAATERPAVLMFHARSSKPARTMKPVLAALAEGYTELVSFALVDADVAPQALFRYGVLSLPTYFVLARGRIIDRFIGLQTREHLEELVETALQKVGG